MANVVAPGQIITTDQLRAERCLKEVQEILRRYNCQIFPQTVIVGNQIVQATYMVVPTSPVPPDLRGEKGNGQGG